MGRFHDEMDWRLKEMLKRAFRAGVESVAKSDVGWTPQCNKCGEEVVVHNSVWWECQNGCHRNQP